MDFAQPIDEDFAAELRTFLDQHFSDDMRARRLAWAFDHDFHERFSQWQLEHLSGSGDGQSNAFVREVDRAGVELRSTSTIGLVASTIEAVGTDEQREEVVPRLVDGRYIAVLGYTEPDSGSDVAAARTRAVRDGDDWVIDGQKMYTSNAEIGTHVFLLVRTNTQVPKHQGLTMFLVPLDAPGVEIREVPTLRGHATYMTYYSGVRVPDSSRIGDVDGGWRVMRVALDLEHGAGRRHSPAVVTTARVGSMVTKYQRWGRLEALFRRTVRWASDVTKLDGTALLEDPLVRRRLALAAIRSEVARLLDGRNDERSRDAGVGNGTKLYASEAYVRIASDLLDLSGPDGLVAPGGGEPSAADGWLEYSYRDSQVSTIAGGCSEVQRDIIAERRLGLPRLRPGGKVESP